MTDRPRSPWIARSVVAALLAVGVGSGVVAGAQGAADLVYASRASGPDGAAGDEHSRRASISADGRYVAFDSDARSLSEDDADGPRDVFVRDLQTEETFLASRASGEDGPAGSRGSSGASLSGDGRYVAFASEADNLSDEDDDRVRNVFVRDLASRVTILVSRAGGASGAGGDGDSSGASISGDGRYVAFTSLSNNFSEEDTDGSQDVFVRDLQTGTTTLVSRTSGATGAAADGQSFDPSLSADGRHVAFTSPANNLSEEDNNRFDGIFVRDLRAHSTTYVSRASGESGAPADFYSLHPSISGDGRYVAFESFADSLSRQDRDAPKRGRDPKDVYVRDLRADRTIHVSRTSGRKGVAGESDSFNASISNDGRYVAFESDADNLSRQDYNQTSGVFLRNLRARTTTYVSRVGDATGERSYGDRPSLAGGGRYLAFESSDGALTRADDDSDQFFEDIFVLDLRGNRRIIEPVLTARIVTARQSRRRVPVRVAVRLSRTRGRPCRGEVAIGVKTGGRKRRRTLRLDGACTRTVLFRFRVRSLEPRVRPRSRRLVVRVRARYTGHGRLGSGRAPSRARRVMRH